MKKIIVFSDCHWRGPNPMDVKPEYGENVFYLGDNWEFKNIPKSKVTKYIQKYNAFLKYCETTGTNVLNGNHEVNVGMISLDIETLYEGDDVALEHGDIAFEGYEYHDRWMRRKPGKSRRVIFGIKLKNLLRNRSGAKKFSKPRIERLLKRAHLLGVKTLVVGHFHPAIVIDEVHKGIRLIGVPRGRSVLYV